VVVKTEFNSGSHKRSKNVSFDTMFQYIVSISMNYKSSQRWRQQLYFHRALNKVTQSANQHMHTLNFLFMS